MTHFFSALLLKIIKMVYIKRYFYFTLFVALSILFTSCSRRNVLAPIEDGTAILLERLGKSDEIIVLPGDTIKNLSSRYNVSVRDLIEINNLEPPFRIKPGDVLRLPNKFTYIVKPSDTLYRISECFQIEIKKLVEINDLKEPYIIKPGDDLVIISQNKKKTCDIKKISKRKSKKKKKSVKIIKGLKFMWPTSGKLISTFGIKEGGRRNDGINIISPEGNPVRASFDGKVIYVGNEIPAWGNLILIKHGEGWTTTYAHLSKYLVKKGDLVKKNSVIGAVGQTGNVSKPQLHFQIRKSTKPLDPMKYLEKR